MIAQSFTIDFGQQVAASGATGTGAAVSITVPARNPALQATIAIAADPTSYWWLSIAGTGVFISHNQNTPGVVPIPAGIYGPFRFNPGEVLWVLATTGSGTAGIIRARTA
jgi:hypothetical protein